MAPRGISCCLVVLLAWLSPRPANAEPIAEGLGYLRTAQSASGAFGDSQGENAVVATDEALAAFRAAGLPTTTETLGAELYLATLAEPADTELSIRRVRALAPTPWSFAVPAGTSHAEGFEATDAFHLALSLVAFRSQLAPPTTADVGRADALSALALPGGCFAFADETPSVELTALVIQALRPLDFLTRVRAAADAAEACVIGAGQPGGGFGSAADTAEAVLALSLSRVDRSALVASARQALVATQMADGSWERSARATALAVRALASSGPDWRIATDTFGRPILYVPDPEPLQGQPVTVQLDVDNRSPNGAPATTIRFRAMGLVLVDVPLAAMAPYEHRTVQAAAPTAGLRGTMLLAAAIDPDGLVPEQDELNNSASAPINVRAMNDLAVSTGSIRFTPGAAGHVDVAVTVQNLGLPLPIPVGVAVYKGTPGLAPGLLGSGTVPAGLAQNGAFTFHLDWNASGANGPTAIHVAVDEANALAESNEDNNRAFRYYFPGTALAVDLSVVSSELHATPTNPAPDATFTVTAPVHNLSSADANRVQVVVRNTGGQLLSSVELPSVPAGATVTAALPLSLTATTSLQVVVDPFSALNDTNRNNNTASLVVSLGSPPYDFYIQQLSVSPTDALHDGDTFTVDVQVGNRGGQTAQVQVSLVDPAAGSGALASGSTVVEANNVRDIILGPLTMRGSAMALRACADPSNAYAEPDENDDCQEISLSAASSNLFLNTSDLSFDPVGADVGERVSMAATVHNASSTQASTVVEWWQGPPSAADARFIGAVPVTVPAGATATARQDWVRADGMPQVYARLTRILPRDTQPEGNIASRHLFLERFVDLGAPGVVVSGDLVRVGRVTGRADPDLVVSYADFTATLQEKEGVALMQREADGHYSRLWLHEARSANGSTDGWIRDVALADLDGDGTAEVVIASHSGAASATQIAVEALEPDGSTKWRNDFPRSGTPNTSCGGGQSTHSRIGIGDVNGDGVADVLFLDLRLKVFSGDDGRTLLDVLVSPTEPGCGDAVDVQVLDVDGDGTNEILTLDEAVYRLFDHTGALLWVNTTSNDDAIGAIIDLDLNGVPDLIRSQFRGSVVARRLDTGAAIQTGVPYESWEKVAGPVGSTRQDGLPSFGMGNNGALENGAGMFRSDLTLSWFTPLGNAFVDFPLNLVMADLLSLGRPQVVAVNLDRAPILYDGRDGRVLLPPGPVQPGTSGVGPQYGLVRSAVVAGLSGDRGSMVVGIRSTAPAVLLSTETNIHYGPGEVAIFSSPHWRHVPAVWPTHALQHSRIGEDLRVSNDYRWWTHDNTWQHQYQDQEARLLADLTIASVTLTPSSPAAGTAVALTATVKNVGGLDSPAVTVAFYDGAPTAGGRLLGTATTPGTVPRRGGTTLATFTWAAYPEGEHFLYAVADPSSAVEESGRENNSASIRAFVQAAATACDLAVDSTSLAAVPAAPGAGDPFELTLTVRNLGAVACPATDVSARDAEDGALLASAAVAALGPGGAVSVSVPLQALPGTSLYLLTLDEDRAALDGDRSNNAATFQLFVPASDQPDLAVVSLDISPDPSYRDESVTASIGLRNLGAGSPESVLRLAFGGTALQDLVVPPLRPGESTVLTAILTAPAASTVLSATVDPDGAVAEFDEANNSRSGALNVQAPAVTLAASATPSSAGPEATVQLAFGATDVGPAALTVEVDATVLGPGGEVITALAPATFVLGPGQSTTITRPWSTGRNAPGAYRVDAVALSGGRTLARASATVTVLAQQAVSLAMGTDRATYHPGEDLLASYRVSNDSLNATLAGASLIGRVADAGGAVLFSSTRLLPDVLPSSFFDAADLFHVSPTLAPGDYQVAAEVRDVSGSLLASGVRPFTVAYAAVEEVRGTLSVAATFAVGPPLPATVALTNPTAVAVNGAELRVLLKSATTLAVESFATTSVSLAAGASGSFPLSIPASGLAKGTKLLEAQLDGRTVDRRISEAVAVVDTEPPLITVTGVSDGEVTSSDVTPVITVEDQSAFTVDVALDGQPFQSGTLVTAEADHVLLVVATDAFGNESSLAVRFAIDRTAPSLLLAGPAEGDVLGAPTTLSWTSTDAHPGTTAGTLAVAGQGEISIGSPTQVTDEGDYTWRVSSVDQAANASAETRHFALDFTPPAVLVTGVTNGEVRGTAATPIIHVTDAHPSSFEATLDGAPFTSGDTVSGEGDHVLHVAAVDAAGNHATLDVQWAQDFSAPVISVTGVHQGDVASAPVTISFSAPDAHPGTTSATLNGAVFASGTAVSADGAYALVVSSTDAAGNLSTVTISFAIDSTAPGIVVTGVVDGECRSGPVTPVVTESDPYPGPLTLTLDGQPFASGTTVTTEGHHLLHAHAVNQAGVVADGDVSFTIDLTAPTIAVSGVADGDYRSSAVTVSASASDANPGTSIQLTMDGAAFTSGGTVSTEGAHVLHAAAADCAGNVSTRDVHFTLDFTPPVIIVSGVSEGQTAEAFTVTYGATDANLLSVSATLDGAAFASGGTVSAEGAHTLAVTAADLAGNPATRTVHFTVLHMAPPFHYAACAFGSLTVRDRAVIGSSTSTASVACNGAINILNNAVIWGDAVSGGNATTRNFAVLHGTLYHGGTFSQLDSSSVGAHQTVSPAPLPCECGYDVAAKLAIAASSNDNALLTSDPVIAPHLVSGGLSVGDGTTLALPGGRFSLAYVRLTNGSRVTVTSGASAQLFVSGKVEVLNNSTLGAPPSAAPALLLVSGADAALNQPVSVLNFAEAALRIYAPRADVTLANTTHLSGAVVGRNLTIRDDDVLSLLPGPQEAPPPLTCP
ncbi:MAG TPA: CARDB domain-containing protein [Myxococcaceae bacterium]|nr:CARDB domain-containing protein [Myxococcaceae bacterium]